MKTTPVDEFVADGNKENAVNMIKKALSSLNDWIKYAHEVGIESVNIEHKDGVYTLDESKHDD